MAVELAKLAPQDPRSVWPHEARDFTPWLAAHLDRLSEVLGLDLGLVQAESGVGDFSIDVLARDLSRDRLVVIENQLGQTDHTHLGQAITYAAGKDAGAVVWISTTFREEHRQAIDWLNRGLGGTTQFFGVVVEVVRIDDSRPAVQFRLVAKPAEHVPTALVSPTDAPTERGARYQQFFQRLIDTLRERHQFTNARVAQPQNWSTFSSGTRGLQYGFSFGKRDRICVEVYIDCGGDDGNLAALSALKTHQPEIENAIGAPLEWEELPDRRACRVALRRPGSIEDADDQLEEYLAWAVDRLLAFKAAFGPYIEHAATASMAAALRAAAAPAMPSP